MIILKLLFTFLFSFFLTTLLGYIVHWAIHQKWAGRLYKGHLMHHQTLYPTSDFYSDTYREAGADDTGKTFILLFSPAILLILALGWFGVVPLWMSIAIVVEMGIVGYAHDYLHEKMHLNHTWFQQFGWFRKLIWLHFQHHVDVQSNFGIFNFWVDRVVGTYKRIDV